jgi:ABC-type amino acid transport substrate-binding protein
MSTRRIHRLGGGIPAAAVAVIVALAAGVGLVGCGNAHTVAAQSAGPTGSAAERARAILGHAPTGLAKDVVDKGVLVVGIDPAYPPQSSLDVATSQPSGFNVDVAKGIASLLGLRVTWKYPSLEGIPVGLARREFDVAIDSMAVTADASKVVDFTDPYSYTQGEVFMRKGGLPVAGPASLSGKSVGTGAATVFYDYLLAHTHAHVKTYTTDAEALPDLVNGTLDYWITSAQQGRAAAQSDPSIVVAGKPLTSQPLAGATRKGEADLVALLNEAISRMNASGQLSAFSKRWFAVDITSAR